MTVPTIDPVQAAEAAERRLLRIGTWTTVASSAATVATLILWDGWLTWDPSVVFGAVLAAVAIPVVIITFWFGRGRPSPPSVRRATRPFGFAPWLALSLTYQVVFTSFRGVWPFESELYVAGQYLRDVPRPDNAAVTAFVMLGTGALWLGIGAAFLGGSALRRPRLLGTTRPWARRALIVAIHASVIAAILVLVASTVANHPNVTVVSSTGLPRSGWIFVAVGWSLAIVLWTIGLPTALRLVDVIAVSILVNHLVSYFNAVPIGLVGDPIPIGELTTALGLLLGTVGAAALAVFIVPPSPGEDRAAGPGSWILTSVAAVRTELHRNDRVPWTVDPEPRPPDQGLAVGIHDRVRKDD